MKGEIEYSMEVQSHFKTYRAEFIESLLEITHLVESKETFFVIDYNVYNLYKNELPFFPSNRLFLIQPDEKKKNIDMVLKVCEAMTVLESKRNTHLISIGGGIVQDITGFVANILYRGIRWTFYPSTLLSACDSCIGGKSSLNYKGYKNLLGTFYPPDDIKIYSGFFHTLTLKDYCSGLGEVVKFNVIAGTGGIDKVEKDIDALCQHDYAKLNKYIKVSLEFKKTFIENDEFDQGVRLLLNFAHTFGHAYECVSGYLLPHGIAVILGMITANHISVQRGYISQNYAERIEKICRKILMGIDVKSEWFCLDEILSAIHKDKKQTNNSITAVLINKDYSLSIVKNIKEKEIEEAIKHLIGDKQAIDKFL